MKTIRSKILVGLLLIAVVLIITGIVWAKATKTAVTGTTYVIPSGQEPLREWIDEDGIWHVRGEVANYIHEGDLEGTGVGIVNLNLDFSTGDGDESGYSTSVMTWEGLSGTFEGSFNMLYTGWVGVGHGVYHGTGDFTGMKLMEDFIIDFTVTPEPPFVVNYEGTILNPHGE